MICDKCQLDHCSYEPYSKECQSTRMICEFCINHSKDDALYEMSSWDNGIGFEYIRNIKYCPICGRELEE